MNHNPLIRHAGFTPDLADILLADVAIRIQLSKTDHDKAVESNLTGWKDWIDHEGSDLQASLLYPQGSMAVGSTVARVSDRDEYDIDVIADLDIHHDNIPQLVLDTLFNVIRGERGSRYLGQGRPPHALRLCVSYEDGMHIDLTPAVRFARLRERTSVIFHSKPEDPEMPDQHLWANPWGLAEWFKSKTRIEADFAKFFAERADDYGQIVADRAPPPRMFPIGSARPRNPEHLSRCN